MESERVVRWAAAVPERERLPAFYREQQTGLVRLAMMLVGDEVTAEDVVQDVFVRLHRSAPVLRDEAKLLAYVRAAVLNGCRSVLRRRRLARRHAEWYEPPVWSAESEAMLGEDHRAVMRALHRLPRRKREVLVLRFYADLSDEEIAVALRVRPSTVRSTLSRALSALERELRDAP
ncbi:SigE family RNA polymerase sigma factor [Actinocorallia aurea]